jgi:hypothetical protein
VRLQHGRLGASAAAALLCLVVDLILRLALGAPYPGATALLLAACGLVLLPLLPDALGRPALRVAAAPALALGSFTIVVTTLSTVGVALTETTIRLAIAAFVVSCAALGGTVFRQQSSPARDVRREIGAAALVLAIAAFAFASAWDIVGPFPPSGTDWGHYFLYADEVQRQQALLIDDPLAGVPDQVFADPAMVGAVYGGIRILDGESSRSFGPGIAITSGVATMSVIAAGGGLWGIGAGLTAGALYAVAPIRLDPMHWHGLATTLALVFVPFVILALGLAFRGRRDARTIGLLAFSLACGLAAHTTTTVVVGTAVAIAVILDAARFAFISSPGESFLRRWWRRGIVAPVLAAAAVAFLLGWGVWVHVLRQTDALGDPVSWRYFEPDWLSWRALDEYLTAEYLLLAAVCAVVVVAWRRSSRDPALLAVAAFVLACAAVSQFWRLGIPYEYRRVVFPFGLVLALLVGAAAARIARWSVVVPATVRVCLLLSHQAIGLRLPQRLLADRTAVSSVPEALDSVRARIDRGELPDTQLVVTDQCLHFLVPFLLERPTVAAFETWQVAYRDRLPAARNAATVLAGGPSGRRLADRLGAGYVVVDPRCTPDPVPGLGATTILARDDVVVLRLPRRD